MYYFCFIFIKKKKTKITVIIASLPYGVLSRLDISDVTYCLMLLEQYGLFQALGSQGLQKSAKRGEGEKKREETEARKGEEGESMNTRVCALGFLPRGVVNSVEVIISMCVEWEIVNFVAKLTLMMRWIVEVSHAIEFTFSERPSLRESLRA